jgi:protein-S-isoprenylcysteine O-methyltransferase Ste14
MGLVARVIAQSTAFFVALGLLLFVPAGTFRYSEAWAFIANVLAVTTIISTYLYFSDPKLLERRLALGERGEGERSQKVLQAIIAMVFFGMMISSALDHRLGGSHVPLAAIIAAHVVMVAGYVIVLIVFRENTYTSAVVEVAEGQHVVSTGPYRIVRHPMYSGAALVIVATPPMLGSWFALAFAAVLIALIVVRLTQEEAFLVKTLEGYDAYRTKTRYRLVPGIF